jgi:putative flippase GtrA
MNNSNNQSNGTEKKDIFDKIMSLKIFSFVNPFYKKYKEALLYLFFGVLTTLINIVVFYLFTEIITLDELVANVIAWIIAVLFAYVTNRIWVFSSHCATKAAFIKEILSFYGGRIFTLLVEEGILLIFIKLLSLNALAVKIVAQVVIIVLNYVISKLFVFKKK